jgi:hypothetical protein
MLVYLYFSELYNIRILVYMTRIDVKDLHAYRYMYACVSPKLWNACIHVQLSHQIYVCLCVCVDVIRTAPIYVYSYQLQYFKK